MGKSNLTRLVIVVLAIVFVVILVSNATFITIEAGNKGVLFRKFSGLEKDKNYDQGFHIIAPWNTMYIYNIRKVQTEETMDVLSSNGLSISVDISARYRVSPEKVQYLHQEIGRDYKTTIVVPEIRAATREVIGQYTPEELYSTQRGEIESEIRKRTGEALTRNYMTLNEVLIRSIKLPKNIQAAIERKLQEEQESQRYTFRLEKEEKEAERRRIEAKGKAQANRIISESLNENVLQDKAIQATLELAQSENAKVVVIGSGKDGLPVILGGDR
jgi:regulator of protease activity HflC (stomatin/prohibitin superfamily)